MKKILRKIYASTIFLSLTFFVATDVTAASSWESQVISPETFQHAIYNALSESTIVHYKGVTTVIYSDNTKIVAMQDDGSGSWIEIESPGVPELYTQMTLAVDSKGELYVLYLELSPDATSSQEGPHKIHVKKYDGTTWTTVGGLGGALTYETDYHATLAIDRNDDPYIAFVDTTSRRASVAAYKGTAWDLVGSEDFTSGGIQKPKLAFDSENTPYLAYVNSSANTTITVQKFDDVWTQEATLISPNRVYNLAPIHFASDDTLYIAHRHADAQENNGEFTYDGGISLDTYSDDIFENLFVIEYEDVPYSSNDLFDSVTLQLDLNDVPYLAFVSSDSTMSVGRYIGNEFEYLGAKNGLVNNAELAPFTLNHKGHPIVATTVYSAETNSPANTIIATYFSQGDLCRFYSKKFQGHFYTSNPQECTIVRENPDWTYEGIAYDVLETSDPDATPVYRFWSDNYKHHFYTSSSSERDHLIANDTNWAYEGIVYGVYGTKEANTAPVYRFWSENYKGHFYTASEAEKDGLIANDPNWVYEGVAWYYGIPAL